MKRMYASHTSLYKVNALSYPVAYRVKKGDVDSIQLQPCQDTLLLSCFAG